MSKLTGFIVTAGHLDIEWYQPLRSYRFWTVEALEQLKAIRRTRSDFVTYCLDGQFYPLKEYLDVVPEDEPMMRSLIQEGLLTIGPFFTQFDEWIPSAESMIRNCLYGERRCRSMGGWMRAGYLPDNFGHPRQLPQILNGFGIDSLLFMRGMPEVDGGHDDEFIYRGIDGSEVFVSHFRESYSGAFDIFNKDIMPPQPREVPYYPDYLSYEYHKELADHDDPQRIAKSLIENVRRIQDRYPSGIIPLIAGFDHLPPQINIGDSVKAANEMQDEIEFVMGDAEQYVRLAKSRIGQVRPPQRFDMELIGSQYQYVLLGALSTRSYLKHENFACEVLLERYAEPLDAFASLYGYPHKPKLLDEAWEFMMVNSAHDSIHGSSVDEVHVEMQARYAGVRQIAAGIIHDAMKHIAAQMPAWGEKDSEVLVVSPTTGRSQAVAMWLPVNAALPEDRNAFGAFSQATKLQRRSIALMDEQGILHEAQVLPRTPAQRNGHGEPRNDVYPGKVFERVLFEDDFTAYVPKKYVIVDQTQSPQLLPAGDDFLENEFLRVDIHGALMDITDKRTGFTAFNLNLIEEDAEAGDAWDTSPTWIPGEVVRSTHFPFRSRLKKHGAVCATIEVKGEMNVPYELIGDQRSDRRATIPMTFEISVFAGSPRVDVKLTLENNAKDHRMRLRIPGVVRTDFVRSQGHLAILDRPVERQREKEPWFQPPTQLLPCRDWIAVQDARHGLAVALKGMYDYEAQANPLTGMPDLFVTLLRGYELMGRINTAQRKGDAAYAVPTPGAQCPGEQIFEWSFLPYAADKEEKAPFLQEVDKYLAPPVGHFIRSAHVGAESGMMEGLFHIDARNIRFSALKKAWDADGLILRLYENQGRQTRATLTLNGVFDSAYLTDMNERTIAPLAIDGNRTELQFAPYKALTIKLVRG